MPSKRLLYESDDAIVLTSFGSISLKLYPDCKPHNLKISKLQKGLVLTLNGRELIDEGIGFGAPVVKYADKTFFSGSSKVFIDRSNSIVEKVFTIDMISKKRTKKGYYLNDFLYSSLLKFVTKVYIRSKAIRSIRSYLNLDKAFRVFTDFVKTEPRGWISFTYTPIQKGVSISVDLSGLKRQKCNGIMVLNEQGSSFFRRYFDSDGLELVDDWIGAWDKVEADEASLSDINNKLAFSLRNLPNATLYRGREQLEDMLSWAGLGYFLKSNLLNFSYSIRINGDAYD